VFFEKLKSFITKKFGKEYFVFREFKTTGKNAQDGHEGMRVTDLSLTPESLKSKISTDAYKLYKLI
jgi:DNA topoisomerase-1